MSYVKNLDINGVSYEIKSVAANNVNGGNGIKTWVGTKSQYDAILTKDTMTRYTCSDTGEIYLGEVELGKNTSLRNIGEIVQSTIPLTDAGLHLLDGALINGNGSYSNFVTHIADLYNNTPAEDVYNVNIVGSLTNDNGVLSGFSASDYAELPQDWGTFTTLELVIKANISTFEQASNIVAPFYTYTGLELAVDSDRTLVLRVGNGSSWVVNSSSSQLLNLDTDYFFKVTHNSGVYTVDVSIDNESWTNYITVSSTQLPTGKILLGQAFVGNGPTQYFLRGSIDLNGCYININGKRWWSGKSERRAGFLTEDEWQQTVTTYGSCGKYVYDSVNNTVRLPKVSDILQGTTDVTALGDLVEAGLPNITGKFSTDYANIPYADGAFSSPSTASRALGGNNQNNIHYDVSMDASRSSSIYGNSTTVQPQTIKVLYYIVIANSTKTDIQVDIDEIATDLNGKADVDLTNVNDLGTSKSAGWAMPSTTYVDLTLGASGTTYTAIANGWVSWSYQGNHFLASQDANANYLIASWSSTSAVHIPVLKGQRFMTGYSSGTNEWFRFIYAVGSESEAN